MIFMRCYYLVSEEWGLENCHIECELTDVRLFVEIYAYLAILATAWVLFVEIYELLVHIELRCLWGTK